MLTLAQKICDQNQCLQYKGFLKPLHRKQFLCISVWKCCQSTISWGSKAALTQQKLWLRPGCADKGWKVTGYCKGHALYYSSTIRIDTQRAEYTHKPETWLLTPYNKSCWHSYYTLELWSQSTRKPGTQEHGFVTSACEGCFLSEGLTSGLGVWCFKYN